MPCAEKRRTAKFTEDFTMWPPLCANRRRNSSCLMEDVRYTVWRSGKAGRVPTAFHSRGREARAPAPRGARSGPRFRARCPRSDPAGSSARQRTPREGPPLHSGCSGGALAPPAPATVRSFDRQAAPLSSWAPAFRAPHRSRDTTSASSTSRSTPKAAARARSRRRRRSLRSRARSWSITPANWSG
jgi:hypothetical protein